MKYLISLSLFLTCCFFQPKANAQFYIGAQIGGVDSQPLPNVGVLPFLGYSSDYDYWFMKYTGGYLQTLIPEDNTSRTVFSGVYANISPEFIFTEDRKNPFKGNVGATVYYGNYYQKETIFLPGISFGFAWGFGDRYTQLEWVGNINLLYAKDKEGTSNGPLHTMAMMGVLWKI